MTRRCENGDGDRQVCTAARTVLRPCNRGRGNRCAGSVYDLHLQPTRAIVTSNVSMRCVGTAAGARLERARIFVVDKGGASVSADRPGSRRCATTAPIESKHDVRRKVRDARLG